MQFSASTRYLSQVRTKMKPWSPQHPLTEIWPDTKIGAAFRSSWAIWPRKGGYHLMSQTWLSGLHSLQVFLVKLVGIYPHWNHNFEGPNYPSTVSPEWPMMVTWKNPGASLGMRLLECDTRTKIYKHITTIDNNRTSAQLGRPQSVFNHIQRYSL